MSQQNREPGVIGYECKHAIYVEAQNGTAQDVVAVKEIKHYEDGRLVPQMRYYRNYQREFWVTREHFRKHRDKKECEAINRLQVFKSSQIKLMQNACRAMGRSPLQGSLRMLARNPYYYGFDVTTPTLIKHRYMTTWPTLRSDNRVAMLDIETDMVVGHQKVIMGSLTMKSQVKIVIVRQFLKGVHNPEEKLRAKFDELLGEIAKTRGINLEIEFVDTFGQLAHRLIQTAHVWSPDFVAVWNINYDVPKLVEALTEEGYDLAEEFSDPNCPKEFKYFKYIQGAATKKTQSGKEMPLHPADRWHTVHAPASFYWIDAMCVYKKIRIAAGNEASYSLDYILDKILGIRKLKFKEADGLIGGRWHTFMQQNYPIEYCVYNLFDCISMELLDETTTDLQRMISLLCGYSEYRLFPSQPRRTCDQLHFFYLERGHVAATTSDRMSDEFDDKVIGLRNWIVTLSSHQVHDDGVKALAELPNRPTSIYAHVGDLDVEGTYPNEEILLNISKATTMREVSQIQGISETRRRAVGINLSGGYVNAVEICCSLYRAPSMDQLLDAFRREEMPGSRAKPAVMAAVRQEAQTLGMARSLDPEFSGELDINYDEDQKLESSGVTDNEEYETASWVDALDDESIFSTEDGMDELL